jgi:hypothetical protein
MKVAKYFSFKLISCPSFPVGHSYTTLSALFKNGKFSFEEFSQRTQRRRVLTKNTKEEKNTKGLDHHR